MPLSTLKYTNGEVTVVWKPDTCIHSRICFTGLKEVFDPSKRPWVSMEGSTTERIIEQIHKCPSGALSYIMHTENQPQPANQPETISESAQITQIQVKPNGPLLISTDCQITHSNGKVEIRKGNTAFCRCGASANKPYCDGSHKKIGFEG